uniref:L-aminoadipate-semialdehyde dehydrogenase-phosphopantetheinyl transferase n=1 Tax=Arion vulgaris TaxID=1028688 RepID=A0A0B7AFW6_9EUPU
MFSSRSVRLAVKARIWNPTQNEWKHAAQCIQIEEKDRIGKFIFKKDAKLAMAGRLLLRYAVSKMLNVPCRILKFSRTDKGKPFLTSPIDMSSPRCDVSFNISHQGDYVVLAAQRGSPIGVDIMKVEWPRNKPVPEFFSTMERQLTLHEWSEVNKRKGDMEQLKTFFRLWCLKESVVKAMGTGIGFQVNRLNFIFKTPELHSDKMTRDTSMEIDEEPAPEWKFQETMLEDHIVAVAVNVASELTANPLTANQEEPSFQVLDIQEILSHCEPLTGNCPDMDYWDLFSKRQEEPGIK